MKTGQRGMTVIAEIHDINLASQYGDVVTVLHIGTILAEGTPATVFTEGLFQSLYNMQCKVIFPEPESGPVVLFQY